MNKGLIAMVALILIGGVAVIITQGKSGDDLMTPTVNTAMHGKAAGAAATPADEIVVPKFSDAALVGQKTFNENCAKCHGVNAAGTMQGPPLIHDLYKPSHHGEPSFQQAAKNGVKAHHWRFGDMKPLPGVTPSQVSEVVVYIRELQRANGIN